MRAWLQTLKFILRVQWLPIVLWVAFQFLWIGLIRSMAIVEDPNKSLADASLIFSVGNLGIISFAVLAAYLGFIFNSGMRSSWLRNLPLSAAAMSTIPTLFIIFYGFIVLLVMPWGQFQTGISIFTIGIPLTTFLILKKSRHFLIGLVKAGAVSLFLAIAWFILFYDWSTTKSQFGVELLYLFLFSLLWLLIDKREQKYNLIGSFVLLILLAGSLGYRQIREPLTYLQAISDLSFLPTQKGVTRFKALALNEQAWQSLDQYSLPSFINAKSQEFVNAYTNGEEKVRFLENVNRNIELWSDKKVAERRPGHFSFFLQPRFIYGKSSGFPISRLNTTDAVKEYLYAHWKDSRVFCFALPFSAEDRFIDKVFHSSCGAGIAFETGFFRRYSKFEPGEFEKKVDEHILKAYEDANPNVRQSLWTIFRMGWQLDKDKYEKEYFISQKPITADVLAKLKKEMFPKAMRGLVKIPSDTYESFKQHIDGIESEDEQGMSALFYLCDRVTGNCDDYTTRMRMTKWSLIESWKQLLRTGNFNPTNRSLLLWIKDEVAKRDHWGKIQKILSMAKRENGQGQ